uniref:VCBS repeat-containing protein n=1 Tax=Roseihalotalea indica TaxID=2867963 RepID=A0AA49JGA9_9BACT|nr:VCBS repeat-containing protein [Tunicatimonas sp. TK19036]
MITKATSRLGCFFFYIEVGFAKPKTMIKGNLSLQYAFLLLLLATACGQQRTTVFKQLPADQTNVHFSNTLEEDSIYHVYSYMNMYTGAGVAAGDVNNDGLPDLYFSGNQVTGRLYLNQGDLTFKDVTEAAGLTNDRWGTGVTMVDINQDGWTDIYVCVSGIGSDEDRANLLYVNNQDGTFNERAKEYGLADSRQIMHAAFLDYDRDNDLDAFLIVNPTDSVFQVDTIKPRKTKGQSSSTDVLYRNEGGKFVDVSQEAGILVEGQSLGVSVSDINQDGWPDIYLSNDFIGNDVLYINQQNGTFHDEAAAYFKHTSYAGMGNDVADFNNDGLVDIVELDMRPEDNFRRKLILPGTNYERFQLALKSGYHPQFTRNTLQWNRGNGHFSEISFLSGISSTDWSWSALLGDYDNDGDKDLFVTNGFRRDLGDLDYINYQQTYNTAMGSAEAKIAKKRAEVQKLEGASVSDYLFENQGDLTFTDQSRAWGIREKGFSNGAVYVDLDNDGDLELVVNTINSEAHIYENQSNQQPDRNYLKVAFQGSVGNRQGIGAKLFAYQPGRVQLYENNLSRGYASSVEPVLHIGLGADSLVDSLVVVWPNNASQRLNQVKVNQHLILTYEEADLNTNLIQPKSSDEPVFKELSDSLGIRYTHRENDFVDFRRQRILPHMHSRGGPGLAVGDINGDGLEDFYVGGAAGFCGQFFIQTPKGAFVSQPLKEGCDSEDMGALLFDADADADLDLYIVSGGSAFPKDSKQCQDRLYRNDGLGNFSLDASALPTITASGSCVVASDYDRDGDLDLFVGGRIVPGEYPLPAQSHLLRNDRGHFSDITSNVAPELTEAGLVTTALWTDYDNDGWVDLLVTGEFMPLRFFRNQQGKLVEQTEETGLSATGGWWNSLAGGDFDHDGDTDYIAGNLGLNSPYRASPDEPLCVYASDYDKNGSVDPVMCYYVQGENYLAHTRDDLIKQITAMRARFKTYHEYASTTFENSFLPQEIEAAYVVRSDRLESSYLENLGQGKFQLHSLPTEAQVAPLYGMLVQDYNQDGNLDVLWTGNSYATDVSAGPYDASLGGLLLGDGQGNFTSVPPAQSGFIADGDAKGLVQLSLDGQLLTVVGNNSQPMQAFASASEMKAYIAADDDAFAMVTLADGTNFKHEFSYGTAYLSQPSRTLWYPATVQEIKVTTFQGEQKEIVPDGMARSSSE